MVLLLFARFAASGNETTIEKERRPPPPVTTLLTRYSTSLIPISIEPNSTAYVLQLNPNITEGLWEQRNTTSAPKIWPANVGKDVLDEIYICELANYTNTAFLNVAVVFNTAFFKVISTGERAQKKKNKDGTFSFSFPVDSSKNRLTFVDSRNGEVKISGPLVKSFLHPVVIPAINPRQTIKIYLINQSRFVAGFNFPGKATAIVADGGETINLTLIRPKVNPLDAVPWWLLRPPTYRWTGVPDAP